MRIREKDWASPPTFPQRTSLPVQETASAFCSASAFCFALRYRSGAVFLLEGASGHSIRTKAVPSPKRGGYSPVWSEEMKEDQDAGGRTPERTRAAHALRRAFRVQRQGGAGLAVSAKGNAARKGRGQGAMPEAISGGVRPSLGQLSDIYARVLRAAQGEGRKPMQSPCARVRS